MSILANDIKVRETGNNSGPWVEAILDCVGLGASYPWCAATIVFCIKVASIELEGGWKGTGRVRDWYTWAKRTGRLRTAPARGYLCLYLNNDGTGHIGAVAGTLPGMVRSIEGNTMPGEKGDQREGGGAYNRLRLRRTWEYYISLS